MLDRPDALRRTELEDLVRQSYEMVVANAPKKKLGQRSTKKRVSRTAAGSKGRKLR
jgi:hypothetical protein